MRWALIDNTTNIVSNIIVWNGTDGIDFTSKYFAIQIQENENCIIGSTYSPNSDPRFIAPTPVAPSLTFTAYEFLLRFTTQERSAYRNAAKTDDIVADFHELATAAQEIQTDNPMTVQGMNYLVSVGILTEQRKNEILCLA